MIGVLNILDNVLVRILNAIVIFTNLAIMTVILILVISRVFGWSVIGMLELATISAMWLYMAGAIVAARNREHLVVDFLTQKMPSKWRHLHDLTTSLIVFAICIFFIYLAKDMLEFASRRPQTTPALSLPLLIPQGAIVVASVFTTIYALRDLLKAISNLYRNNHNSEVN